MAKINLLDLLFLTSVFGATEILLNDEEKKDVEDNKLPVKLGKIQDNDGYIDNCDVVKIGKKVDEILDYLERNEKGK